MQVTDYTQRKIVILNLQEKISFFYRKRNRIRRNGEYNQENDTLHKRENIKNEQNNRENNEPIQDRHATSLLIERGTKAPKE